MVRFYHRAVLCACAFTLAACGASVAPPPSRATDPGSQVEHLKHVVERYWDENAVLTGWYTWGPGGDIAPQSVADSLALERRYLDEVSSVPRTALDAESKLTYDIFTRARSDAIEGFTYPFELLPVNPYDGVPQRFALTAAAAERLALANGRDFGIWRNGADRFSRWATQAIDNMRDGMRRGYTLPRPLVEKAIPVFAALGADTPDSIFYRAIPPDSESAAADHAATSSAMKAIVAEKILPSFRALQEFLQKEYLPRARTTLALSSLPLGDAWYAYLVKRSTDSAVTPGQLHALGVTEVEKLRQRVQTVLSEASFAGNAQAFSEQMRNDPRYAHDSAARPSSTYDDIKVQVAAAMASVFSVVPQGDYEVRDVEAYREAVTAPLTYRPRAPNGLISAVLYVNGAQRETLPVGDRTAQYLREAVPGHHYQLELQRERNDLPRFRRFATPPAFVEGWGLYAATLGEDLGLYHAVEARFGLLVEQTGCAAGLVIDTGIHAQGWTRQQALDYLHAQLPIDNATAELAVDRVIALPGEALSCTVGFLKIQRLRAMAQQALGARFDVRAFHAAIIGGGAMPLDLLETSMKAWIEDAASRPPVAPAPDVAGEAAPGGASELASAATVH